VPTIWNYDSNQFSAEDQWASSIRDTLYSSIDTVEDSAAAPLAATAWLATVLPGGMRWGKKEDNPQLWAGH
jgi:hypothetical protein